MQAYKHMYDVSGDFVDLYEFIYIHLVMYVEYGGDIFATFEDGEPVEVNLSLRFKEIELLTKENILTRGL